MSGPVNAITPAGFRVEAADTFIAANSTLAKVLVETTPGAAAAGTTPALYGGCTVLDIVAASTDASNKDVILYIGNVTTTQDATNTGAMTTTTSTITRTNGSFITDGWRVGDLVMTFAPANAAPNASQDGVIGTVTTVAALTLTVNGTPFAALTLANGTRVVRVRPHFRATVAANSGTNGTSPSVGLLNNGQDGSSVRTELKLGPTNMLIAAMQSAVSALPAYVSIGAVTAQY